MRRGSREPNIAHLLAANLACTNVFKTIVATNYDDLALGAFWSLPANDAYAEPYVVCDPRTVNFSRVQLGEEVPIIVNAHGHHTNYGVGILDHQLRQLAPFVKRAMRWCARPRLGFVVVGYSGGWDDGVMQALRDRRITRGKRVYWFFRRSLPDPKAKASPFLNAVVETSDVRSIRRDCLNHGIVLNEQHLNRILDDYFHYYRDARTHLALDRNAPVIREVELPDRGRIGAIPQVGELHHRYRRAA